MATFAESFVGTLGTALLKEEAIAGRLAAGFPVVPLGVASLGVRDDVIFLLITLTEEACGGRSLSLVWVQHPLAYCYL